MRNVERLCLAHFWVAFAAFLAACVLGAWQMWVRSPWGADIGTAIMVGNHRHDLAAGRAAGVPTVHVAIDGVFAWPDLADLRVFSLRELASRRSADFVLP